MYSSWFSTLPASFRITAATRQARAQPFLSVLLTKLDFFFDISHKTHKVFHIHAHKKAILNILWDKYFFIPLFFHTFVH